MPFYYDFNTLHDNAYLRFVRKIHRPLHFEKGYNLPLWVIFGGAMLGFGLSRLEYLDINGVFAEAKVVTGDWYYWQSGYQYIGIILHLAGCIPVCLLVPWQFLPIIRHNAMWLHRINGYLNLILMLVSIIGAFMIAQNAAGGALITQLETYVLGVWIIVSLFMAYVNIKRLQIDQHRIWMLRAWFVAAYIITLRIIQIPIYEIVSRIGMSYMPTPCRVIDFVTNHYTQQPLAASLYLECANNPNGIASVKMDFFSDRIEEIGAAVNGAFGISSYVALILHAVGIEIYIRLTPAENERLRKVSYEKQLARGMKPAGYAGLTAEILGDAPPFRPNVQNPSQKSSEVDGKISDESEASLPDAMV